MKTLKVIRDFRDKENDKQLRKVDEVFEVSNKRGKELLESEENVVEDITEEDKK